MDYISLPYESLKNDNKQRIGNKKFKLYKKNNIIKTEPNIIITGSNIIKTGSNIIITGSRIIINKIEKINKIPNYYKQN